MSKTAFTAALVATLLAGTAFAQVKEPIFLGKAGPLDISVESLLDSDVYFAAVVEGDLVMPDVAEKWDNIGEVEDLILAPDGSVKGIVLEVGGFLAIGEKHIGLGMDSVRLVRDREDTEKIYVVVDRTLEQLKLAPEYEYDRVARTRDELFAPPKLVRDGYTTVNAQDVTVDKLVDAVVYGSKDETVGDLMDIVLNQGHPVKAVIDVGGFLGMGGKRIAVSFEELQLLRNDDGDLRIYIEATEDQLERRREYTF